MNSDLKAQLRELNITAAKVSGGPGGGHGGQRPRRRAPGAGRRGPDRGGRALSCPSRKSKWAAVGRPSSSLCRCRN